MNEHLQKVGFRYKKVLLPTGIDFLSVFVSSKCLKWGICISPNEQKSVFNRFLLLDSKRSLLLITDSPNDNIQF